MTVGVVVVHYSDWDATKRCVRALESGSLAPEVIVIDNDADNIGYGAACNRGFEQVKTCDRVIFMNNDTIPDREMVKELCFSGFDYSCPVMTDENGKITFAGGKITMSGPLHFTEPIATSKNTEFLQGACICVDPKKWVSFDPSYFMYFEDVELSKRVKKTGYSMGVVPSARLVHPVKRSVLSRYWAARNYRKCMGNSWFYFLWWIPKRAVFFLLTGRWLELLNTLKGMTDGF